MAITCLIFTSSCKKEINYHPEWNKSSMSGKIDGSLLECILVTAQTYVVGSKATMQISGFKGTSGFSLIIDDFKGVGTYNIVDNNIAVYLAGNSGPAESYLGHTIGTIKITRYTAQEIIIGTFEFKGENPVSLETKNISEGYFNINLIKN